MRKSPKKGVFQEKGSKWLFWAKNPKNGVLGAFRAPWALPGPPRGGGFTSTPRGGALSPAGRGLAALRLGAGEVPEGGPGVSPGA